MYAILKKELNAYFTSVFAYLYYALFFLVTGIFFIDNCLNTNSTQFGYYVLSRSFLVTVIFIPLCTMKLFAQEKREKTDQLLFTAPLSTASILAGKYIATAIFVLLPILISGIYPLVIATCGEMSIRFMMGTYIAIFLVVLVLLAIGIFISSLVSNALLAAVIMYTLYAIILLGRVIEGIAESDIIFEFVHAASVYNKFYDMISGIIRSGDVLYLTILIVGFLFLTWFRLEGNRQKNYIVIVKSGIAVVLMILFSALGMYYTKVYDFTAEQLLSLSDSTKEVVTEVDKETTLYYIGEKSRVNATYRELLNAYHKLNENIKIEYKDIEEDISFRENYLSEQTTLTEASILVVCGERKIYLDANDYISTKSVGTYSVESLLNIENQLTSAIYYTNAEEMHKLYTISGHEEESIGSSFQNLLLLNNYEVEDLNLGEKLLSLDMVFPEDCEAVIINAPQSDYTESEVEALKDYLEKGGKLFIAIDSLNEETEIFWDFIEECGFDIQHGVVIEQETGNYIYDTEYYLKPQIEKSELSASLLGDNIQVLTMTSKGVTKNDEVSGYTYTRILTTSSGAFSKVDDFENTTTKGENDISGPFSIAACAKNTKDGEIFLITSNMFFYDEVDEDSNGANKNFFRNIMNHLTGNETMDIITGKEIGNQVALYSSGMKKTARVLTIVVVPVVILGFGIFILICYHKNFVIGIQKRRENNEDERK